MPEDYSDYETEELEELYHELSGKLEQVDDDSLAYDELKEEVWEIENELQAREDGEYDEYDEDEEP